MERQKHTCELCIDFDSTDIKCHCSKSKYYQQTVFNGKCIVDECEYYKQTANCMFPQEYNGGIYVG